MVVCCMLYGGTEVEVKCPERQDFCAKMSDNPPPERKLRLKSIEIGRLETSYLRVNFRNIS